MITPFGIIGIVIGITNLVIGTLVYIYDRKNLVKQWWALFAVSVSIWGFGTYIISIAQDPASALFWWRLTHIGVIVIPTSFLIFTYYFFERQNKFKTTFLIITSLTFLYLNSTPYFIKAVRYMFDSLYYDGPPTALYSAFVLYFVICMLNVLLISGRAYFKTTDTQKRRQVLFFFLASAIGSLGGGTSFLPVFGIKIYPYLNASIILFPFIIGYAILRYGLFNLKAVITELLIFSMWIFLLLKAVFSTSIEDTITSYILLVVIICIGILLIKSVRKEIHTREKIQNLANDLSIANDRLRELDQQKSEFVSLASHQLRGPLTAVKGYSSMLLDGDFGIFPDEAKDAIDKIYQSVQALTVVVNDYLDVSRIEQGRMQYDMSTFDMRDLVSTVVTELKPNITRAKITLDYDFDPRGTYMVNADMGKIKQVIGNIIDNAIKYTPKGGIHVWLSHQRTEAAVTVGPDGTTSAAASSVAPVAADSKDISFNSGNKVLLSISDTGVGIHPEVLPRLFEKFTRAPDASKTNIMGTGLGLYVAKKMIEAHHGKIWAESPGPDKGSTFFIELDGVTGGTDASNKTIERVG